MYVIWKTIRVFYPLNTHAEWYHCQCALINWKICQASQVGDENCKENIKGSFLSKLDMIPVLQQKSASFWSWKWHGVLKQLCHGKCPGNKRIKLEEYMFLLVWLYVHVCCFTTLLLWPFNTPQENTISFTFWMYWTVRTMLPD